MEPLDPTDLVLPNRAARRAAGRRARRVGAAMTATMAATGTAAAMVGLLASPAGALTQWTVNQGGDAGNGDCDDLTCTLRDAVEESNNDADASAIVFDASITGTIVLTGGDLYVTEDNDLTVTGPGAGILTVSGNDTDRIFRARSGFQNSTLSISGLTLTDGQTSGSVSGGAILFYGDDGDASLVLTNMVITGNHAEYYGGGVAFYGDADMTVTNSTIANNTTQYSHGGGILFARSNELTITNSTISGNQAGLGGDADGGGLVMYSDGNGATNATIANSTIANNSASHNGGGIALYSNNITLLQTTISGNTAGNIGDGLYLASQSTPQGVNARNAKPEHQRGDGKESKTAKAEGDVGALYAGTVTITGTIISANPGTDIDTGGDGATVDSTNSLIGTVGSTITVNNLGGTIFNSLPGLALLANNGGFTQTMALQVFSPAIDTGPTTVPTFTGNENDQRGAGFLRVVNGRVDIGAYEVQAVPLVAAFTG